MFLKNAFNCSNRNEESLPTNEELNNICNSTEESSSTGSSRINTPSSSVHSHSNSTDSTTVLITSDDFKKQIVIDDLSESNSSMIANQSETIRKSVRVISHSPQSSEIKQDESVASLMKEKVSNSSKIDNQVIASRFDLIDNATDVSTIGDTFKLIASDIVRLISNMKLDGIELVDSPAPTNEDIEDAILRLFGQLFQNLGLIECCRTDLFHSSYIDDSTNLETIKNNIISTLENVWRELEQKPQRLDVYRNILKILSCMQQESISKCVIDVKSRFKTVFGGKVRLFDGRMWIVELYFNSSSIEVVHYRTEKLCTSGSKEVSSASTPRSSPGFEEICKFVWSTTFTFHLIEDNLELDLKPRIDFQALEGINENIEVVTSFLSESSGEELPELSREECEQFMSDHFQQFFKFD